MSTKLEVNAIHVAYRNKTVVFDTSLQLQEGMIGCLLGPSGCGKTTVLRAIAGFEPVTKGEIILDAQTVSLPDVTVPPEQRRVGMVFQDFALFPHMNISDNVGFGIRHQSAHEQSQRSAELLELVDLSAHARKYPHELSGGQQQRVALARAMAPRPQMLLMDEPFSSMDAELREELAGDIRAILKQENMTAILVTHDQFEAFAMADEIGVMQAGRIVQWDSAYNLYHEPATRFVADFIGLGTMLKGKVLSGNQIETEIGILEGNVGDGFEQSEEVEILVRPDDVVHNDASHMKAIVTERQFRGAEFLYELQLPSGAELLCFAPSHHDHKIGESIGITIDIEHLVMFKLASQAA